VKSLVWLSEVVLQDCGTRCGADTTRDILTVKRRVEHEGESFLTITLPSFGEAFDRAIAEGRLSPSSTPGFTWHRGGLPEFLRGFLRQVFDPSGVLVRNPSIEAIASVRQVCYLFKKVNRDCSAKRTAKAIEGYLNVEKELKEAHPSNDSERYRAFKFVAGVIWSSVLRDLPYGDPWDQLRPKHGPGATAERILGNAKFLLRRWHTRLEGHFPFTEFGVVNSRFLDVEPDQGVPIEYLSPDAETPVRVVTVPKTLKGPRIIAVEPVCMQYTQQALLQALVPLIETGKYTSGRVNFARQSVNRDLALSSSRDGKFATLDLKDASDRVHKDLVYDMLECAPRFREYVFACRTTRASVLGSVIELNKFASMGSALCFPMEAMVFYCTVVAGRMQRLGLRLTPRNVYKASRDVYIYGDDILVPTGEAPNTCVDLEAMCLKVNYRKSFWTGKFRESCGMDAYDGEDVTPVYCRSEQPTGMHHAERFASWVSMANQFYLKGFWKTTKEIRKWIEIHLGTVPFGTTQSEGLCFYTFTGMSTHKRWNRELMRFERRAWIPSLIKRTDSLEGKSEALLKCLLGSANSGSSASSGHNGSTMQNGDPTREWWNFIVPSQRGSEDHLLRSAARGKLVLKSRWVLAN